MREALSDYLMFLRKEAKKCKCTLLEANAKLIPRLVAESYGVDPSSREVLDSLRSEES